MNSLLERQNLWNYWWCKNLRSEIGIIYLSNYNKSVLQKIIRESNLKFLSLIKAKPHIFISENHPLASKK